MRTRLALRILLLTAPLTGLIWMLQTTGHVREIDRSIAQTLRGRMTAATLARCERAPRIWPRGPLPPAPEDSGPALNAYGLDLRSANPAAPPLPPPLRAKLAALEVGKAVGEWSGDRTRTVVVRTPAAEGPCAFVTLTRRTPHGRGVQRGLLLALAMGVAVAAVAWLAGGPAVNRIHRLAGAVARTSRDPDAPLAADGDDEISQLAKAFETSRRTIVEQLHAVERSDQALRQHLTDTRHDLVTPLTVLQGHLAALEPLLDEPADSEQQRLLAAAAEECDFLARLLDNLSATTTLRAGDAFLETNRFDLNPVVERSVGRYRRLARSRAVGLDFSVPPGPTPVEGDLTVCERAIGNLVDNALRYNLRGGNVAVVLEHDGASTFLLQIIDDGPGVGDATLAELRTRGARLDHARSRSPQGQGLGLDIVISVAEHHGWSFELCCRKPRGLTASLAGPRAAPGQNLSNPGSPAPISPRLDDDP